MNTDNEIKRLADICKGWYAISTSRQRATGSVWYPDALAFCWELADNHRMDTVKVTGVVAALSPAVYWDLNKRQAEALLQAYATGGMESADQVVLSTYGRQAVKAKRILALPGDSFGYVSRTAILDILGRRAFKTRTFFLSILDNDQAVCIDRHIITALNFSDRWVQGSVWCYDLLADAIRHAADDLGLVPHDLQAIIWITFKEVANAYSLAEQGEQHDIRHRSAADLPM